MNDASAAPGGTEYTFIIDAYQPETLPMARLAEYMTDLAMAFGEERQVHFVRLDRGSVALVSRIEDEATVRVEERVVRARAGTGPQDAVKAVSNINKRLKEDNTSGVLVRRPEGAEIIRFPGREEEPEPWFGSVTQDDTLEGQVVRIGGVKEWVPVHLRAVDGHGGVCLARRDTAKALALHLFGSTVRVFGAANWFRGIGGVWSLERFYVERFDVLDDAPLGTVVADLRSIAGSEWPTRPDPWAELNRIRHGAAVNG